MSEEIFLVLSEKQDVHRKFRLYLFISGKAELEIEDILEYWVKRY